MRSTATRRAAIATAIAILSACGASTAPRAAGSDPTSNAAPTTPLSAPASSEPGTTAPATSTSQPRFEHERIGASCATKGAFGFAGAGPAICDGTWRYALTEDLPPTPNGGYQSRPDWYPTLTAIFNRPPATCPSSDVHYTASVLPVSALTATVPYGAMVYDHVTPIDHGYLGLATLGHDPATLTDADYVPVVSPGDGTIIEASSLGGPTTHRVVIDNGCGVFSVFMVVNRLTGVLAPYADEVEKTGNVRLDIAVHAGDEFGMQRDNPVDFNVFDQAGWLKGFAQPLSYAYGAESEPYLADPLKFFSGDLRATYEQIVQRTAAPRWGVIDHDVVGAAAGSWFITGTIGFSGQSIDRVRSATSEIPGGNVDGKNGYSWGHLAFAPHWVQSNAWIASFGWWADPKGDFRQFLIDLQPGQPTPDQLTSASGVVVYKLADWQVVEPSGTPFVHRNKLPEPIGYEIKPGRIDGLVAVQVNADDTLTIETMPGATSPAAFKGFTSAARTYHR